MWNSAVLKVKVNIYVDFKLSKGLICIRMLRINPKFYEISLSTCSLNLFNDDKNLHWNPFLDNLMLYFQPS